MITNEDAKEAIKQHIGLIKNLAYKLTSRDRAKDLIRVGESALFQAMEEFDKNRNVKLATFAYKRIQGAMIDFMRANGWFSPKSKNAMYYIEDLGESEVIRIKNPDYDIDSIIEIRDMAKKLRSLAKGLTKQEKEIIYLLYNEGYSLSEASKRYGVTEQRISRIHRNALKKMKGWLKG